MTETEYKTKLCKQALGMFAHTYRGDTSKLTLSTVDVEDSGDLHVVIHETKPNRILAAYWVNDLGDLMQHTPADIDAIMEAKWRRP